MDQTNALAAPEWNQWLVMAMSVGEIETAKKSAAQWLSQNARSDEERALKTLLSGWISEVGHDAFARGLLACGADGKAKGEQGETALLRAARMGHAPSVALLLPASDVQAAANSGWTALMWAAHNNHMECMEILLSAGDARAKAKDGDTALMCAARQGRLAAMSLLLPRSDPRATDNKGRTALMHAVEWGGEAPIRLLLPVSDALAKDDRGETALMWAVNRNDATLVRLLMPHSDLGEKSHAGDDALARAIRAGNMGGADLLACAMDIERARTALDGAPKGSLPATSARVFAHDEREALAQAIEPAKEMGLNADAGAEKDAEGHSAENGAERLRQKGPSRL